MRTADSRTHGLIPEMKIALILANLECTINIKLANHAAVYSRVSMNSGENAYHVDMSRSPDFFMHNNYMHTASCRIMALRS